MITKGSSFKAKRDSKLKERATTATYSWNMLFMGTNAVAETLADKLGIEKSEFYAGDKQNRCVNDSNTTISLHMLYVI